MKLSQLLQASSIGVCVGIATFGFQSCNEEEFLDVQPTGVLTQDVLGSRAGIEGLLVGGYAQLNGRGNRLGGSTNWVHGSIRGGDANKGTDPGDFGEINPAQRYELVSTDRIPADKWRGNFEGVSRANQIITVARASEDPSVTEEFRANAIAQAKVLRAHFYFNLQVNFNMVPYFDETVPPLEIPNLPNTVVWGDIERDLAEAIADLPETQDAVGKVNRSAAQAYLGKVYLHQGNWAQARTTLEEVIANGQTSNGLPYALEPYYANVFNAEFDNGAESVWAMQAAANTGSVNNANPQFDLNFPHNTGPGGPGGCCGFFQPSFDLVSSFRTTDDGLPLLDGSYRDADNRVADDMGIAADDESYTEDEGPLDPRLDHSVGRRGIPYLDWGDFPGSSWIRNQPNGGPFSPKKFVYYRAQEGTLSDGSSWTRGYTSMNYNIIRFADVLLMAAEAHIEDAGGDRDRALELVNIVRQRAIDSPVFEADGSTPAANYVVSLYDDFSDQDFARDAVHFERKLELSGEGHRFYDLLRWGVAEEFLDGYIDYESMFLTATGTLTGADFRSGQDEYYPIPQTQLDLMPNMTQNPGY